MLLAAVAAVSIHDEAAAQCSDQKILAPDGRSGDEFGFCVALDGTTAAIGAPFATSSQGRTGAILVYERSRDGWQVVQRIAPPGPPEMRFGHAVGISGRWMVVGAPGDDTQNSAGAGAVYVFERSNAGWALFQKLEVSWVWQGDQLGYAVAIDGDRLVSGIPDWDPLGFGAGSGDVATWRYNGTWKLEPYGWVGGVENGPWFLGTSVAIDGTIAVAGAPNCWWIIWPPVFTKGGGVILHDLSVPGLFQGLANPDEYLGARFGQAVSMAERRILVGAPFHPGASTLGAVYAFEWRTDGGAPRAVLTQRLLPPELLPNSFFGSSLAMSGDRALISCGNDSGGVEAYSYRFVDDAWVPEGKLSAAGMSANPASWSNNQVLALDGDQALVGVPAADDLCSGADDCDSGAVFSFRLPEAAVPYCFCTGTPSCGNPASWAGCWNSTLHGALLQGCASSSVNTDGFEMQSHWLPPDSACLVIMGPRPAEHPLGDGVLCVGPGNRGLFRFQPGSSSPGGVYRIGPGIAAYSHANFPAAGQIQPGETWYFQTWYRDALSPCATGVNLTNGLKVEFTQ